MHPIPWMFLCLKKNINPNFPVEYYTEKEINRKFSFPKAGALVTDNDSEINPYKNAHLLIEKAVSKGVRVYAKTKINGKILKENQTQLFTETGHNMHRRSSSQLVMKPKKK
jgi:hypothetical protein